MVLSDQQQRRWWREGGRSEGRRIIDDTGFPKKMLWGRRRDSCKIVASINGH
jgi:hypothetical protein